MQQPIELESQAALAKGACSNTTARRQKSAAHFLVHRLFRLCINARESLSILRQLGFYSTNEEAKLPPTMVTPEECGCGFAPKWRKCAKRRFCRWECGIAGRESRRCRT